MKIKKMVSCIMLIIFSMAFLAGCGGEPADIALKRAMVASGKAESVAFDVDFKITIDDKKMPKDDESYADFYAYAENSSIKASNKLLYTNKMHTAGLISSDISYTFAKDANSYASNEAENSYEFNVITNFDFTNLSKKKPSMTLVQAYKFKNMPKRIYSQIPGIDESTNRFDTKIFSVTLSDNEVIKNFMIKALANSVPNWSEMLSTMTWGKQKSDYILTIGQEILKESARQMYDCFDFKFSEMDKSRVDAMFEALEINSTNLKYSIAEGKLSGNNWVFNGSLDFYKLNNSVLGKTNGFDIKIPLTATLDIKFTDWDAVERFNYPTLTEDTTIKHTVIEPFFKEVFPKLAEIKTPYTKDQIIVTINGKKVEFFDSIPPCIYNDKVYLPLKYMFQQRGGTVASELGGNGWRATAKAGVKTAILLQNSSIVNINGENSSLSAPIIIHPDYNTFYAPYELFKLAFDMEPEVITGKMDDGVTNKFTFNFVSLSEK